MRFNNTFKAMLITSGLAASVLLLTSGAANAQVALTAQASTATLPDGQTVPMWGFACGTAATTTGAPTCASLNPLAGRAWAPPVITVQTGTPLQIILTNSLPVPTSLVIVGQLGGGLGSGGTTVASPAHAGQTIATWPTAGTATVPFTPPAQGKRVQSFATEVAAGTTSSTLTWSSLKPGT